MNTPVSFEIKQLLFNKGWKYKLGLDGHRVINSLAEQRWNEGNLTYVDITITDVIMWLYETHGIWIYVVPAEDNKKAFKPFFRGEDIIDQHLTEFYNSPTEAYLAAIDHCLKNNLLKKE